MRLAVAPAANVALWGSEGSAVEVPVPGGGARFLIRLNSLTGQVGLPRTQKREGNCRPHERREHVDHVSFLTVKLPAISLTCAATFAGSRA